MAHAALPASVPSVTPLKSDRFDAQFIKHPDQHLVAYVLDGIRHGFRVAFDGSSALLSSKKNKQSAQEHPSVVDDYLANEVSLGRVAGPFAYPPFPNLHISKSGVIPKSGQPGKWRLIVGLSSPEGASVNDGIDPEQFTLNYIRVDDIIKMIDKFSPGASIAKFDVMSAYRNVPVHPSDRYLLGMRWRAHYYVDLAWPFGLRSAPYIFNTVASMVEWILVNNHQVSDIMNYLDDFILAGPPDSPRCARDLSVALQVCTNLGLPLHPGKCGGPSSTLTVLGIELDLVNRVARLPADKLANLRALINKWSRLDCCIRHDLESLIGHLHHAAKVVWPGQPFIRRLIDQLRCFRHDRHPIRINNETRHDMAWWQQFLESWNSVSFWLYPGLEATPTVGILSTATWALGFQTT
ncbi:uncharacterized protein LOC125557550 [Nematostella vectensis]|uniref:uncharacterized protein LOC125557550 n=1 Tax=Nematostella vectensis TaxID=45351 RepID=UPI0020774C14|nr:uncharacterized protein LOC125557550 [Nematostella vectensis]